MKPRKKRAAILVTSLVTAAIAVISVSCIFATPSDDGSVSLEDFLPGLIPAEETPAQAPKHTINVGAGVSLAEQTIAPSGGVMTIDKPGDPLDGLKIEVPPDAYGAPTGFEVSSAPITGHDFGDNFNPVSPLITVENGGGYSDEPMLVSIPVDIPEDSFAMGFLYNEESGTLEGVPLVEEGNGSITVATRHFSNLVVSVIKSYILAGDIDSGFRPGVDDWQFTNYGSYISPGGHCWGQSLSAMWYYCERARNGAPHLYNLYDDNGGEKTPNLWQDDSLGYRLASTVQEDESTDILLLKIGDYIAKSDELTYQAFAYSILVTGEPQYVRIRQSAGASVHAMVVYRVANNTLFIADPNFPGRTDREIDFAGGQLKPYSSGDNARAIEQGKGVVYDKIDYLAKTTFIKWVEIGTRWSEFDDKTVGDDRFPAYSIEIEEDDGTIVEYAEGLKTASKSIWFDVIGQNPDVTLSCWVWRDSRFENAGANGYELLPGLNHLGLEITGETANDGWQYVDFKYVDIYTANLSIEPAALSGEPGKSYTFTAKSDNMPAHARYEWDFGDGTPGETTTTSQVSHQFTDSGSYTINLTVYNEDTGELFERASAVVSIMPKSQDLLGILQTFSKLRVKLNGVNTWREWNSSEGEHTRSDNFGLEMPWSWGGAPMDITWNGTSFTGTLLHGDPDYMGNINEVSGSVSADGTTVQSLVFSYRFRDEGTDWVTTRTIKLEFANMPLAWQEGQEALQTELKYELHGAEVPSHVNRIEFHQETLRNGEPESTSDYVSTDWAGETSLYLYLIK